jgi:hypothetical protein
VPLADLSKPALMALVKLAISGKTLCTPHPAPYQELWQAGYAYVIGFGGQCFALNVDRMPEILAALHLAR